MDVDYLIVICLGLAISAFGIKIVKMPFSKLASTALTSMSPGRLMDLENLPASLSRR
jgi:hypothetical protein